MAKKESNSKQTVTHINKSAVTGEIVSTKYAHTHPATTYAQTIVKHHHHTKKK